MDFKLDKNHFWAGKVEDKPSDASYYGTLSMVERLKIAYYLNSVAYSFDIKNPPKMDKTFYTTRKRD